MFENYNTLKKRTLKITKQGTSISSEPMYRVNLNYPHAVYDFKLL